MKNKSEKVKKDKSEKVTLFPAANFFTFSLFHFLTLDNAGNSKSKI